MNVRTIDTPRPVELKPGHIYRRRAPGMIGRPFLQTETGEQVYLETGKFRGEIDRRSTREYDELRVSAVDPDGTIVFKVVR